MIQIEENKLNTNLTQNDVKILLLNIGSFLAKKGVLGAEVETSNGAIIKVVLDVKK